MEQSTKVKNINIPKRKLNKYEFLRSIDKIRCTVSVDIFWGAIGTVKKPIFLAYWIFGVILFIFVSLGIGKYFKKILYWLLYKWKRKYV